MRRIICLIVCILFFCSTSVFAADLAFQWNASAGATGYKVQISTDNGVTWGEQRDAGANTTYTWIGAPDTGFLIFRFIAYRPTQEAIRSDAGIWYNGSWKLPTPTMIGVQ